MKEFWYKGKLTSAHIIAEKEGVELKLLWSRLKTGYSVEDAINAISPIALDEVETISKCKLDLDSKQKDKRDKVLLRENACFAQCAARINSK